MVFSHLTEDNAKRQFLNPVIAVQKTIPIRAIITQKFRLTTALHRLLNSTGICRLKNEFDLFCILLDCFAIGSKTRIRKRGAYVLGRRKEEKVLAIKPEKVTKLSTCLPAY